MRSQFSSPDVGIKVMIISKIDCEEKGEHWLWSWCTGSVGMLNKHFSAIINLFASFC